MTLIPPKESSMRMISSKTLIKLSNNARWNGLASEHFVQIDWGGEDETMTGEFSVPSFDFDAKRGFVANEE